MMSYESTDLPRLTASERARDLIASQAARNPSAVIVLLGECAAPTTAAIVAVEPERESGLTPRYRIESCPVWVDAAALARCPHLGLVLDICRAGGHRCLVTRAESDAEFISRTLVPASE